MKHLNHLSPTAALGGSSLMFAGPDFIWSLKQPNISWRENTAGHGQSRRFLECISDNFLMQMTKEPMRGGHSAGPHTYKPGRIGCGCEGQGQVWLQWQLGGSGSRGERTRQKVGSQPCTSGEQIWDLLERIPVQMVLERGVCKSWLTFKDHFLWAQEQSIPIGRKWSKGRTSSSWQTSNLKKEEQKRGTKVRSPRGI